MSAASCTYSGPKRSMNASMPFGAAAAAAPRAPHRRRPGRSVGDEPFGVVRRCDNDDRRLVQGQQLHDDVPTPPAAAETATVSPSFTSMARTAAYAVQPTT